MSYWRPAGVVIFNGQRVLVLQDKKNIEMDSGEACPT
jgi:hypothetical protein